MYPELFSIGPVNIYTYGVLLATERSGRRLAGRTFWLYMVLYAISRCIVEVFRGDPRGALLGFSTSQFISLVLEPLAIAMLIWLSRTTPDAPLTSQRGVAA